ncbi:ferrous iron transport protein B [Tumebacillus sp. ITR2]|uniref:Ferrous iron transport protein B n=1 Tax=Tumebacillus amylolyticus TaxID=2801339 RepID=A0ABS1J961_9BACL|nr:ferrous iron transport protein B [Tumebacillus amylolyticus]MBL0386821.1 ferrous iron transport protein B [Tumebacillus amylolyticus]
MKTIALAGNPNAGKTSLFNVLTGTRQYVGNWAGVTVEKKEGWIKELPGHVIVDLPGIYSLSAQSLEEKLATAYLLEESPGALVNIVDASNLERNLYFTVQLLEMGLPSVVALNMIDVSEGRGLRIDGDLLAKRLGAPVVPMVARKAKGHEPLVQLLKNGLDTSGGLVIPYPEDIEAAVGELAALLDSDLSATSRRHSSRWMSILWLEGNETVEQTIRAQIAPDLVNKMERIRRNFIGGPNEHEAQAGKQDTKKDASRNAEPVVRINHQLVAEAAPSVEATSSDLDQRIRNARYEWIGTLLTECVEQNNTVNRSLSDRIDNLILNKWLGIPIFLAFMYLVFQITFSWIGTTLSDQIDTFFSGPLTDWLQSGLTYLNSPDWFRAMVIDGLLAGVGGVLVFVPQIGILFLCLSFLEDSGYMARAAVLMDRFMSMIGLNGKAFIPLILGFGCNVPAIMATRTLEDQRGRMVTAFISPFMSCSARLSVYSLFVSAFFERGQATIVFLLYLTGIVMAIGTAYVLKRFLPDDEGVFLMELPPYRAPMFKSLMLNTWDKARGFVRKAGTIIFGMSVLLWFLGNFSFSGMSAMDDSFLAAIGGFIAPAFALMGFASWQAGVSLLTGFMAKEVVVSTMAIAYASGDTGSLGTVLQSSFTPAAALAFLFFVLLYTPCVSTVAMMKRETGSWKWTLASIAYSFGVAWIVAYGVYRLGLVIW